MPPSTNNLFPSRGTLGGGRRKSGEYRQWLTAAGWAVKLQVPGLVAPLFRGPVAVVVDCGLDRRGDLDNRLKAPLDLLVRMGVLADDSWVDELHIRRRGDRGRMTVSVAALLQST